MREGIFVKDLLHRGPASESGRIHPGDRIASVKISFRNMVYEDALTILSYASPYDVQLEVETGASGSKPTTLLKKSVGPSPTRICHPLYRSQSIPELSQTHKSASKRLFIADPNESAGSNYSTMNSTLKSSKSTPGVHSFERRHEEPKNNHHHHKFGIKVLPSLDGMVHRIETQNEHNTNLERRHSRKLELRSSVSTRKNGVESLQQREDRDSRTETEVDVIDREKKESLINIPSEVPTEVHNAAMAARRNRRNSTELLTGQKETLDPDGLKSPQKNKRKAPAPPEREAYPEGTEIERFDESLDRGSEKDDRIDSIVDFTESLTEYVKKAREAVQEVDNRRERQAEPLEGRNSESDTDSEVQNSFTTIELNPGDITIHRTPVPEENEDDQYRKAASLGDLSKYESKASTTLERAQSLDMTDTSSKKRKAPLPPEDINESTEDLTKLDQMESFDRRKLKKSNEWGTLEDVLWSTKEQKDEGESRKKNNGTLERSKSAIEIKFKDKVLTPAEKLDNDSEETSIELYNLPLSKRLTEEFIHAERMFDPEEDNSLARIVNDGAILKSPRPEELEQDLWQTKPLPRYDEKPAPKSQDSLNQDREGFVNEDFSRALRYFEMHTRKTPTSVDSKKIMKPEDFLEEKSISKDSSFLDRKPVSEKPATKITLNKEYHICDDRSEDQRYREESTKKPSSGTGASDTMCSPEDQNETDPSSIPVYQQIISTTKAAIESSTEEDISQNNNEVPSFQTRRTRFEEMSEGRKHRDEYSPIKSKSPVEIEPHFGKCLLSGKRSDPDEDEEENEYEFGSSVTINSKSLHSRNEERHNVSNVSVSSGENSEDSGLVRESMDYSPQDLENRPPLPSTPMPDFQQKTTYVTEIKVAANRASNQEQESEGEELFGIMDHAGETRKIVQQEIKVTSNGKPSSGRKPPVPPRRSDITKTSKEDNPEKQVVYVSEYKSNFFKGDKEQRRWANELGDSQSVTNITLPSGNEKIVHQ
ncbi:hypothetical protein KM043_017652 [Ampulex compressa]|nr:hypothetical protein KM043_017652 [Ampulex compressa]